MNCVAGMYNTEYKFQELRSLKCNNPGKIASVPQLVAQRMEIACISFTLVLRPMVSVRNCHLWNQYFGSVRLPEPIL